MRSRNNPMRPFLAPLPYAKSSNAPMLESQNFASKQFWDESGRSPGVVNTFLCFVLCHRSQGRRNAS
eukprot:6098867-Amphidinium_carterae.1